MEGVPAGIMISLLFSVAMFAADVRGASGGEAETIITANLKAEEAKLFAWNYERDDPAGPQYWGNFSETCTSGLMQSPIDLSSKKGLPMGEIRPLEFAYKSTSISLSDDGKTIHGKWAPG